MRPSFCPTELPKLLDALRGAREWVIKYSSAQPFNSPAHNKCEAIKNSIDDLAGELTGQRDLFHAKPHGGSMKVKNGH
jgi:hypothetical protein